MAQESLPTEPRAVESITHWDEEADVVVVGYGGAGVCAALEAARAGASVLALERAGGGGGTTAMSTAHIYMGGGTRVQKAVGLEDSVEDMFRFVMASADDPDEEKVRLFCDRSLDHFAWLVEQGVPFKDSIYPDRTPEQPNDDCLIWSGNEKAYPFREIAKPAARGHKVQAMAAGGPVLFGILAEHAARAGVRVLCDTRVLTLITRGSDGRVCGVVARRDGRELCVRARRGVILCAGGFVMNREMLRNHIPTVLAENVLPIGNPHDDGAGIRMGLAARGSAIHMGEYFITVIWYPPSSLTKGILVNELGQRFVPEDSYHGRCAEYAKRQKRAFLIADNAIFGYPENGVELLATEDSIEELERVLEIPEGELQHTVRVYNEHAAKGEDPLFHKHKTWLKPLDEPPFAALECSYGRARYMVFTLGGLKTRTSGEVVTEDGREVPGLYAAGRNACGIPRSSWGYCSGTSVADATFFGRRAGMSAAKHAAW
ncbi:MAG TPA: FAD-dependent oxidoreductase [Myxococcota bacterium]|nr:FAD-dependent oxidoreductase [Myxococcota bacterium]